MNLNPRGQKELVAILDTRHPLLVLGAMVLIMAVYATALVLFLTIIYFVAGSLGSESAVLEIDHGMKACIEICREGGLIFE